MLPQIGSSKVRNANKRITIENKFLGSLSIQCDDESLIDCMIEEDGQVGGLQEMMEVVSNNSETVRFVKDGVVIGLDAVRNSLYVIASCKATIKKFTGR